MMDSWAAPAPVGYENGGCSSTNGHFNGKEIFHTIDVLKDSVPVFADEEPGTNDDNNSVVDSCGIDKVEDNVDQNGTTKAEHNVGKNGTPNMEGSIDSIGAPKVENNVDTNENPKIEDTSGIPFDGEKIHEICTNDGKEDKSKPNAKQDTEITVKDVNDPKEAEKFEKEDAPDKNDVVIEDEGENKVSDVDGQSIGNEDDDIPLSLLVNSTAEDSKSPVVEPTTEEDEPKKVRLSPLLPSPFVHIRGRPGLRSGSPQLNASFTVRSEPSSPSGLGFPRLRKADAQMSLVQPTPSRKRSRVDPNPDSPSPTTKRPCQGWLGFNLSRWWRGDDAEPGNSSQPASATEALAESATPSVRSCILM